MTGIGQGGRGHFEGKVAPAHLGVQVHGHELVIRRKADAAILVFYTLAALGGLLPGGRGNGGQHSPLTLQKLQLSH